MLMVCGLQILGIGSEGAILCTKGRLDMEDKKKFVEIDVVRAMCSEGAPVVVVGEN